MYICIYIFIHVQVEDGFIGDDAFPVAEDEVIATRNYTEGDILFIFISVYICMYMCAHVCTYIYAYVHIY
jgi:hypothetical protein